MPNAMKWIGGGVVVCVILYILAHTVMPESINDNDPMTIFRAIAFFSAAGLLILGSATVALRAIFCKKH